MVGNGQRTANMLRAQVGASLCNIKGLVAYIPLPVAVPLNGETNNNEATSPRSTATAVDNPQHTKHNTHNQPTGPTHTTRPTTTKPQQYLV